MEDSELDQRRRHYCGSGLGSSGTRASGQDVLCTVCPPATYLQRSSPEVLDRPLERTPDHNVREIGSRLANRDVQNDGESGNRLLEQTSFSESNGLEVHHDPAQPQDALERTHLDDPSAPSSSPSSTHLIRPSIGPSPVLSGEDAEQALPYSSLDTDPERFQTLLNMDHVRFQQDYLNTFENRNSPSHVSVREDPIVRERDDVRTVRATTIRSRAPLAHKPRRTGIQGRAKRLGSGAPDRGTK
ncbi:hypothetical protein K461DRAFT_267800 [Myriangium duriaei CBS 260.36]|uniref:Uncharacterized protein n=1 Tax=Myriangium duriaei CBS 260.36 TaxID=1168546 RepID=A0A9P4J0D0_9PEZI|nr:hypothetical protein K461DRAFT_267800 [Myriangium duriaei CBS 260.36]